MPRFFVSADQLSSGIVCIRGSDAEHLRRSLRVRPGETLVVVEDAHTEHRVRIERVAPAEVVGTVVASRAAGGEPALHLHVLVAVAAQHMEAAIEGVVASGASSVRPVVFERSVVRPDPRSSERRVERWRAVALNAAQLSGRAAVPPIHQVAALAPALATLPAQCRILACVIGPDTMPLAGRAPLTGDAAVVIGPEGGLTPSEISQLRAAGAELVHLGPRTLPHHLAGAAAVTLLLGAAGDLSTPVSQP